MDKLEEIREGIAEILCEIEPSLRYGAWSRLKENEKEGYMCEADEILSYLASQGVVLAEEVEVPENPYDQDIDVSAMPLPSSYLASQDWRGRWNGYNKCQQDILALTGGRLLKEER